MKHCHQLNPQTSCSKAHTQTMYTVWPRGTEKQHPCDVREVMRISYPKDCENKWRHKPDRWMCDDALVLFVAAFSLFGTSLSLSTFLAVELGQRTRPVKHSLSQILRKLKIPETLRRKNLASPSYLDTSSSLKRHNKRKTAMSRLQGKVKLWGIFFKSSSQILAFVAETAEAGDCLSLQFHASVAIQWDLVSK